MQTLLVIVPCTSVTKKGGKQGQKLIKKESDVGMLLTGIQSTETRCM